MSMERLARAKKRQDILGMKEPNDGPYDFVRKLLQQRHHCRRLVTFDFWKQHRQPDLNDFIT